MSLIFCPCIDCGEYNILSTGMSVGGNDTCRNPLMDDHGVVYIFGGIFSFNAVVAFEIFLFLR